MKNLLLLIIFLIFRNELCAQGSWSYLSNTPFEAVRYEDVFFVNDNNGWAISFGRLIHTSDGGQSWKQAGDTLKANGRSVEFLNENIGFAGTLFYGGGNNRFYKTVDAGNHWLSIDTLLPGPSGFKSICGMSHIGQSNIYAVGAWFQGGYFYRSVDTGRTWTYKDLTQETSGLVECFFLDSLNGFVSGKANDSIQDGIILKTIDGGNTWNTVYKTNRAGEYVWKLQFMSSNLGYASIQNTLNADSSFILKTVDGGNTWEKKFVTSINLDEEGIGFVNDSVGWVGGYSYGTYQTKDGGNTWHYYNFGNNLNRIFLVRPGLAYGAGSSIYKWEENTSGTSSIIANQKYVSHILNPCFPNPSNGTVTISYSIAHRTNVVLSIFNQQGKFVTLLTKQHCLPGSYQSKLDSKDYPSGVYIISLGTDEFYLTQKLLVVH